MNDINRYFNQINSQLNKAYEISNNAKKKGYDPKDFVEVPIVQTISQRVENLLNIEYPMILNCGIKERIHELEQNIQKLDLEIALIIAKEIAQEKFCKFNNKEQAILAGIRFGFAYLTLGIISAPLEGLINIEINTDKSTNSNFLTLNYAGPIRAAGGTAGAFSVIIADYLRKEFNINSYTPKQNEIMRTITEINDYNTKITNLQYLPENKQIETILKNIGVKISGPATETVEVTNYKNIEGIKTNKIRGGMCLILCECIAQKSNKINRTIEKLKDKYDLKNWEFTKEIKKLKENSSTNQSKLFSQMVAGRPVVCFPKTRGGLRLRYGRSRVSGFASCSLNPLTIKVLDNFIATGTQLRLDFPGKATIITQCDSIEGPIVKLKSNEVKKINNIKDFTKHKDDIIEIIHLGDILVSVGEFVENNYPLQPNGYCNEEWAIELVAKINQKEYLK